MLPMRNRLRRLHIVRIHKIMAQPHIARPNPRPILLVTQKVMRKPQLKRRRAINILHVLLAKLQAQRLDIPLQVDGGVAHR
jgi:hypothetical protein